MPLRLVLAVQDEQYIEPFLHFARSGEFDRGFSVTAFSRTEAFAQYMEQYGGQVDAVLGETAFFEAVRHDSGERITCIRLCEDEQAEAVNGSLYKYQPLPLLLSAVFEHVRGKREGTAAPEGRSRVYGVTGAVGGCGKTTLALHLVRHLASEGKRVFYLNLETIQSGDLSAPGRGAASAEANAGLARLLYDLKAGEERQAVPKLPVTAYCLRHPVLHGDTFAPLDNLDELMEIGRREAAALMEFIAGSGLYDVVLVDTDSFPHERTETVMEKCDKLVWMVADDWGAIRKTGAWLAHLEKARPALFNAVMSKTMFAANRISGEVQALTQEKGIQIAAFLPLIPAWTQGNRQGGIMHSPIYQREVMKLIRMLSGRKADSGKGGEERFDSGRSFYRA
ncbi:hypothetical protein LBW89_15480 [Paenibacillus sp. alder61]|uniref:hypothetical protein n=1 Tax=Paenibacillus TaxID=44249 RepID=UPI001CD4C440|nr:MULTISPECIES: hypothetical protein [Paenibacillus]MCA1294430.1 hypothetical protein [Paenibacillus sp. alder61]